MYEKFYGLNERPFNLTADTQYLFSGSHHKEALEFLSQETGRDRSLIVLTGEIGSGKTVVLSSFVKELGPGREVFQVFYPTRDRRQLLQMVLLNMGVKSTQEDLDGMRGELKAHVIKLKAEGKTALLMVDEAQNLGDNALREVVLLSGNTDNSLPLHVILAGLPLLQSRLSSLPDLMTGPEAVYHLNNLQAQEVAPYIHHRLHVAGCRDLAVFDSPVISEIARLSGGAPRLINTICDSLLVQGFLSNQTVITLSTLDEVPVNLPCEAAEAGLSETAPKAAAPAVVSEPENGPEIREHAGADRQAASARPDEMDDTAERKGAHQPAGPLSPSVLVFEKNIRLKVHLENNLLKRSYNFTIINNFEELFEALDRSESRELPLVVADVDFFFSRGGVEDSIGKSALDRIQTAHAYAPIIMTSTLPLTAVRTRLFQRGISYLLQKPDLSHLALSEVQTRFDSFFNDLQCCLTNLHGQLNAFYYRNIKSLSENTDT